jgi:hypothetical protein
MRYGWSKLSLKCFSKNKTVRLLFTSPAVQNYVRKHLSRCRGTRSGLGKVSVFPGLTYVPPGRPPDPDPQIPKSQIVLVLVRAATQPHTPLAQPPPAARTAHTAGQGQKAECLERDSISVRVARVARATYY